jgi:excisionase family DNA binding protein
MDRADQGANQMDRLLTKSDVANFLQCSTRTVDRLRAVGDLRATEVRGRIRFHPDDVLSYVAAQRQKGQS